MLSLAKRHTPFALACTNRHRPALLDNLMLLCKPVLSLGGPIKLHSDLTFEYYKVPFDSGIRMLEGATTAACRKLGMEAVCRGQSGCRWIDESKWISAHDHNCLTQVPRCQTVPMSAGCGNGMQGLSKVTPPCHSPSPPTTHGREKYF